LGFVLHTISKKMLRTTASILLLIISLFFLFASTHADMPVHCEFPQVKGRWRFSRSDVNIARENVFKVCDYSSSFDATSSLFLTLSSPNIVIDERTGVTGNWTILQEKLYFYNVHYEIQW